MRRGKTSFYQRLSGLCLICFCVFMSASHPAAETEGRKVYVISVQGPVEPGLAAYIRRSLDSVDDTDGNLVVFKLDTFGGRVDSAFEIMDAISEISNSRTLAYVEKKAISAGALIALSADSLYMRPHTIIGDCAPIISTQEGQKVAGEKIQTVLRARFRALAKKNGYPPVLSQAMVTMEMEVYQLEMKDGKRRYVTRVAYDEMPPEEKEEIRLKKTIVAQGELLTMDDAEALEYGFSRRTIDNLDQLVSDLGFSDAVTVKIEQSWSEGLVRFLQPLLPILMLLGIGALYTEIKAPGFGIFGIAGILFLGLVFFNQYLTGLAHYTEMLLFIIGILLFGVEIFVLPGFGIAGITGLIVIGAGLVLSFQDFVLPDPAIPWQTSLVLKNLAWVMGTFVLAFGVSLFSLRYILPWVSARVSGPYLGATLRDSKVHVQEKAFAAIGDKGIVHSFLRPSGKVIINGRKLEAVSESEFIEKGVAVKVAAVRGSQVVVSRILADEGKET